jgi:hypothetical protein
MFEDTLTVRYYARPNGRMSEIEMSNIDQSEKSALMVLKPSRSLMRY